MSLRTVLGRARALCSSTTLALAALAVVAAPALHAQEQPARRLSSIASVAVEEYGKAVDARGHLISAQEYSETVDFLRDARDVAGRLSGDRAAPAQAVLDTLIAAVQAKRPPQQIEAIHTRLVTALGAEGALELPTRAVDVARGRSLFGANCASCHGERGLGDGPAAAGLHPAPPAIGTDSLMHDVTPAMVYRIISVGVTGTPMPSFASTLSPDDRWDIVTYLASLRATPRQLLEGEGLYLQRCASCHGTSGTGDGTVTRALTRLPPEIGTIAYQAERSDAQLAQIVKDGLPGTAMPPSRDLSDAQVSSLVAYLRSLPGRQGSGGAVAAASASPSDTGDAEQAARQVSLLLEQSLAAARSGRMSDAGDRAFDSYIAFEPLETPARAKNPGLVSTMERHFADFKGAIRNGDLTGAERARNAIEAGLPDVVALTHRTAGGWAAFFQSLLIILREGFEAMLVIGAVVAFLIKTGHREQLRAIWLGGGIALAASAVTAVVLRTILAAIPASSEIIEGVTLLIAVVVLFSVSYWLISKVEAARWQQFIREKVTSALEHGGSQALALVAFLAVYREGAETALFYQALFSEGPHLALPLSMGIIVGFALLTVIFTLFYRFGVRIPLRPFFTVTSALLYYMAFVFMGKGLRELQEGNAIPITVIPGFPHVDAMGIYPSVETLLGQLLLLALLGFALVKTFWPRRSVALPTITAPPPAAAAAAAPAPAPASTEMLATLAELRARTAELQERIERLEGEIARADEGEGSRRGY